MAIDDKFDALEKAFPKEQLTLQEKLLELCVPTTISRRSSVDFEADWAIGPTCARGAFGMRTVELLIEEVKTLKARSVSKADLAEVQEAMQIALRNDVWEFNNRKRDRYIQDSRAVHFVAERSTTWASYIQDVERLGERGLHRTQSSE